MDTLIYNFGAKHVATPRILVSISILYVDYYSYTYFPSQLLKLQLMSL